MFEKLFKRKPKKVEQAPKQSAPPNFQGKRPDLQALGVTKNSLIPPMLDPAEMGIRTKEELYRRMIALWAVVGTAKTNETYFC